MDSSCMGMAATNKAYGLSLELTLQPPGQEEHSKPQEKNCKSTCSSSSNHSLLERITMPYSARYTSKNKVLQKIAIKNTMLKKGVAKAFFTEKTLIINPMPEALLRSRRKVFQRRPSRLSTMSNAEEYTWLSL